MWIDISRGIAALKSAWSLDSTLAPAETATSTGPISSGDFLDEAENYIHAGRHQSAAMLAGDALELTLRKLCAANSVYVSAKTTIDVMNSELVRKGVYNDEVEQRLSAAASLSEQATCGLWSEFTRDDVERMLAEVRAFTAEHAIF
jgi:hypothetical protein